MTIAVDLGRKATKQTYTFPRPPGVGSKLFLKVVILHIKLKEKKCRSTCKQKKMSDIEIVQNIFFIELITKKKQMLPKVNLGVGEM